MKICGDPQKEIQREGYHLFQTVRTRSGLTFYFVKHYDQPKYKNCKLIVYLACGGDKNWLVKLGEPRYQVLINMNVQHKEEEWRSAIEEAKNHIKMWFESLSCPRKDMVALLPTWITYNWPERIV